MEILINDETPNESVRLRLVRDERGVLLQGGTEDWYLLRFSVKKGKLVFARVPYVSDPFISTVDSALQSNVIEEVDISSL